MNFEKKIPCTCSLRIFVYCEHVRAGGWVLVGRWGLGGRGLGAED